MATVARGLLGLVAPSMAPCALVFPASILATLVGGIGAGIITAIIGLGMSECFFMDHKFVVSLTDASDSLTYAVTLLSILVGSVLADRYNKMMRSRAREREELMRARLRIFEQSHGFTFVLRGPEFRYEYANPACLQFLEMEEKDLVGKSLKEVWPHLETTHFDPLVSVLQTGEVRIGRNLPRPVQRGGVKRTHYIDCVYQPMRGDDGSIDAILVEGHDVTEKVEGEQRLQLLVREVDHRANNLLGVVKSVVTLSKADSVEALRRNVLGRIGALARAHQLLSNSRWRGANLEKLVEEELRPYTLGDAERAHVEGESMPLSPAEAEGLAMALHELATNAAKYGAFSTPAGRVEIIWARDNLGARNIRWKEDGGPPVVMPDHKGLGVHVLERAMAPTGGRTRLSWRPEGLVCDFDLPPEGRQKPPSSIDEQMEEAGLPPLGEPVQG